MTENKHLCKHTLAKSVLTFGEPLLSFARNGTEPLAANRTFAMDIAGAELNTAVGLARLGCSVRYAAVVGADPLGDFLMREIRAEQIDTHLVHQVETAQTGLLLKLAHGFGEGPSVYYYRDASPMARGLWQEGVTIDAIQSGSISWVHTTGITWMLSEHTKRQSQAVLTAASQQGLEISFDVNIRRKLGTIEQWKNMMESVIPYVTWIFMGDSEASLLYDTTDGPTLLALLRERGFRGAGIIEKFGDKGSVAVTEAQVVSANALAVPEVVDVVGAGDGFNAGWIAGYLKGYDLAKCLHLGNVVGAFAVTSVGDASGYPTWKVALQKLTGTSEVTR